MDSLQEFQRHTKVFKLFFFTFIHSSVFYLSGSPLPEDKQSHVCFVHSLDSVLFDFRYRSLFDDTLTGSYLDMFCHLEEVGNHHILTL